MTPHRPCFTPLTHRAEALLLAACLAGVAACGGAPTQLDDGLRSFPGEHVR